MDYNMLKTNAINAINALLEAQLMAVSRESGIDITILQKYVGDSSAPVIQEKKKRAPPKKKVPITDVAVTEVPINEVQVVEKKKRAPPKKKVQVPEAVIEVQVTEVQVTEAVTEVQVTELPITTEVPAEKKKRAPPKKKVTTEVAQTEAVTEVPVTTEVPAEKKKRAPPKKKVTTEVEAVTDVPVEEKKKRAPPKKKEPANKCYLCKNTKDLRSTGNSDGYVCQHCVANSECQAFCKTCNRYEETDGEGYCGKCQDSETETVKLPDSSDEENVEYVESSRHPVREVDISGTIYLVDNEEVAFLKSSKKRVGKYNRDKHRIQALDSDSDSSSSSSDDELPICDDDM